MVSEEPHFSDVHKIAEVYRQLRHNQNPETLTEEALRILGATEPEYEFMAIATWCQRCSLIHKLYPDKYPLKANEKYKIPDLFAVFQYKGKDIPVFIEVKSTYSISRLGKVKTERLSKNYRDKLINYSQATGIPVLIANQIQPGGFWALVDIRTIGVDDNWRVAFQNDLMGTLLGTSSLSFQPDLRFIFTLEKRRTIKEKGNTKKVEGIIRKFHFEIGEAEEITNIPFSLIHLFGLVNPLESTTEDEKFITTTWEIGEVQSFFDYQALRSAILIDKQLKDEKLPWSKMLQNGKFPFEYSSLEEARNLPNIFRFQFHSRPHTILDFLPDS